MSFAAIGNDVGCSVGCIPAEASIASESAAGYAKQSTQHSRNVVSHISSIYGDTKTSDVVLLVGSDRFSVHKLVISQSPVFKAMLYGDAWQESSANEVELNEICQYIPVFEDFLKYVYGCPIQISWQNVEALVYFGDKYAVDQLLNECLDFFYYDVARSGDLLSALKGWKMIRRILSQRQDCMNVLRSVLFSNIELIMKNESIINSMDEDDITAFMASDEVVCRTEFTLFRLFEAWLLKKADASTRLKLFLRYSVLLRLPYMRVQEMSYVENSPGRLFSDETSQNFKEATSAIKSLLCDAYKYHVLCKIEREKTMVLPRPRLYTEGSACMEYRLMNTDGLCSWSKMDSYFKVKNTMSNADATGNSIEYAFCVTLMRKINVRRQLQASSDRQRVSLLSLEISQNFCGQIPFKCGEIYIRESRAGSVLRRPLTRFDFTNTRMKSDIKLDNINFEDVVVKNSPYQYDDEAGNLVFLALDIFLLN